ncbi:hypothetical protein SC438_15790, partial [Legionella pneumophila]
KPLLGRSLRKTVVKISNFKATGLLRRYAPRNDGPKNRTVQRLLHNEFQSKSLSTSRRKIKIFLIATLATFNSQNSH